MGASVMSLVGRSWQASLTSGPACTRSSTACSAALANRQARHVAKDADTAGRAAAAAAAHMRMRDAVDEARFQHAEAARPRESCDRDRSAGSSRPGAPSIVGTPWRRAWRRARRQGRRASRYAHSEGQRSGPRRRRVPETRFAPARPDPEPPPGLARRPGSSRAAPAREGGRRTQADSSFARG